MPGNAGHMKFLKTVAIQQRGVGRRLREATRLERNFSRTLGILAVLSAVYAAKEDASNKFPSAWRHWGGGGEKNESRK